MYDRLKLAYAFLGGALCWFLHLTLAGTLAEALCVAEVDQSMGFPVTQIGLGVLSFSLLVVTLGAIYMAKRLIRERKQDDQRSSQAGIRFLAEAGMLANLVFAIIIVLQATPILALSGGCR